MSDLALKNALLERDRIAAEISQIQQRLDDLNARHQGIDEWILKWHQFAAVPGGDTDAADLGSIQEQRKDIQPLHDAVDKRHGEPAERTRATGNPKKEYVAAVARRIISVVGEPVSRSDLFRLLSEHDVHIEGKDPEQVLSTMLWRTRSTARVARLPSGGYWLAEVPHAASNYVPAPDEITYRPDLASSENEVSEDDDGEEAFLGLKDMTEATQPPSEDVEPNPDDQYDAALMRRTELEGDVVGRAQPAREMSGPAPLDDDDDSPV